MTFHTDNDIAVNPNFIPPAAKPNRGHLPNGTLVYENPDFDEALIGVTFDGRAIYSYEKMVEQLMKDDNIDELEAMEFIDYNTLRATPYFGKGAPIVMSELF